MSGFFQEFTVLFSFALLAASCALAWFKGGGAEKGGCVCILVNWIVPVTVFPLIGNEAGRLYLNLATDGALALALLVLALRFSSAWLGSCMVLQGASLTLQSMQWTGSGTTAYTYHVLNNILALLVLVSLAGGSIASWRKRFRGQKHPATSRKSYQLDLAVERGEQTA